MSEKISPKIQYSSKLQNYWYPQVRGESVTGDVFMASPAQANPLKNDISNPAYPHFLLKSGS